MRTYELKRPFLFGTRRRCPNVCKEWAYPRERCRLSAMSELHMTCPIKPSHLSHRMSRRHKYTLRLHVFLSARYCTYISAVDVDGSFLYYDIVTANEGYRRVFLEDDDELLFCIGQNTFIVRAPRAELRIPVNDLGSLFYLGFCKVRFGSIYEWTLWHIFDSVGLRSLRCCRCFQSSCGNRADGLAIGARRVYVWLDV